jgi:Type IV secretion system pilin
MKSFFTKASTLVAGLALVVIPFAASAQVVASGPGLGGILRLAYKLIRWLPPFLISLAVILLIWNVIKYVIAADGDATKKKDALKSVGMSFLGLVFVLSIWGILAFISGTLGLGIGGNINESFVPGVDIAPPPTF